MKKDVCGMNPRTVQLFNGYSISENGEITSRFCRVVKHQVSNAGYVRVELYNKGKGRKYSLHRLLAQAFIPNPEGKPVINHKDGNKLNNALDNLEWATRRENQLHAYQNGLQKPFRKSVPLSGAHKEALCGSRWRGGKRVYHAEGKQFDCPSVAAEHFGFNRQTFYNRAMSDRFPTWFIEIRKEVENA